MTHVHSARDLLKSIGLYPIIVAEETSFNMSVNQKVRHYMGMCTSAIVLATVEDEQIAKEQGTRPNVEHEVGLLQASNNIGDRIAYCKEHNVKFASNYSEKVWIPFEKERLERSYIPLLREIRGFGLLGP
jgi:predicted nucleotide-binding protein